ncbi:MAG: FAD-binding protein [Coriobacteriales bacterium]|nr:FAD-binding protein [Coriobacteriales bacterium]
MEKITRRSFVAGTAGLAILSNPLLASAAETADIVWEAEADYVIIGTGAAGLSAAATCGLEELGDCLILEAAPEALRGGNSRVCGQGTFCPMTVEGCIAYQTDLNRPYVVEPELVQSWAENICENGTWLEEEVGAQISYRQSAEFPEAEGAEFIGHYASAVGRGEDGSGGIWQAIADCVAGFDIPIYYDSRAVYLIHDVETKEVQGVTTEDGRNFKARKAVILGAGGFEWNQEMMDQFNTCGFVGCKGIGTIYNRGDGIKMAAALGAQLWHMNNFSGKTFGLRVGAADDDSRIVGSNFSGDLHDYIFLDPEGKRFMYEESRGNARHGKVYEGGTWADLRYPGGSHAVFTQASYDAAPACGTVGFSTRLAAIETLTTNDALLEAGIITKSETVAELAQAIGADEAVLQAELDKYNRYVANGYDADFHRGQILGEAENEAAAGTRGAAVVETQGFELTPIEPPFYSYEMIPFVINSQGGPKRDATGNIVDLAGNPIPRLYGAGEMGCIYPYKYNVGGNFSEAISSGRLAMRSASALEPWA